MAVEAEPTGRGPPEAAPAALGGGSLSSADDINAAGEVVGRGPTAHTGLHAFLWIRAVGMTDLNVGIGSEAFAINNAGQVVGYSYTASSQVHATLWTIVK